MKKAICLGMAAILAFGFTGCKQKKESFSTQTDTTVSRETQTIETEFVVQDDLPKLDFKGEEFHILTGLHGIYPVSTFSMEEETGELLNDVLYDRNRTIEERFHVKFVETVLPDIMDVNQKVKAVALAGDATYDLAMMIDRFALAAGMDGQLHDYNALPYLNLEKPYWNQNAAKDFSINNRLFFTYGDDNLVFFGSTTMMVFNKNMLEKYQLEDPYTLVREGKWTMDKYFDMAKQTTADINGDGKYTIDDQYGIVSCANMHYPNFWLADGIKLVEKDDKDLPYFNVPGNEKFMTIFQKIYDHSFSNSVMYCLDNQTDWKSRYPIVNQVPYGSCLAIFKDGKALFSSAILLYLLDAREMEDDFGIIPYPKSEEVPAGTPYPCRTFGGFPYVVPISVTDTERASVLMEALACESYKKVIPVLYDKLLKTRTTRDTDSAEMLDMMRANRLTDLAETYWWDDIEFQYENLFRNKKNNYASFTEKIASKVQKKLQKSIDFFS